jgi:hypothetical protein
MPASERSRLEGAPKGFRVAEKSLKTKLAVQGGIFGLQPTNFCCGLHPQAWQFARTR